MPKVRIELLSVTCRKTEDIGIFGSEDEFYIAGALFDGVNSRGVLTPILDIDNGDTKPYQHVIFDSDVPLGQNIRGGLKAFDEDTAKDWEKREDYITKISNKVASELESSGDPLAATAGMILRFAVKALGILFPLDKDDELGSLELNIPASGSDVEEKEWNFNEDDSDYTVRYRIIRGIRVNPTSPVAQGDNMQPGEVLNPGQSITSTNGQYTFVYQGDGNLVLYRNSNGQALWASNTWGRTDGVCIMQGDGNFVIYDRDVNPIWTSNTWQHPGSQLVVQSDGNVVIYNPNGTPVWATNTWQGF